MLVCANDRGHDHKHLLHVWWHLLCNEALKIDAVPLLNHPSFFMTTLPESYLFKQQTLEHFSVLASARHMGEVSQENEQMLSLIITALDIEDGAESMIFFLM